MSKYKDTILKGIKENLTNEEIIISLMAVYGVTVDKLPEGWDEYIVQDIGFLKANPDAE
jgi:hypothetical protein